MMYHNFFKERMEQDIMGAQQTTQNEFMAICKAHPSCIDCPLKTEDVQLRNNTVRCKTGRGEM